MNGYDAMSHADFCILNIYKRQSLKNNHEKDFIIDGSRGCHGFVL